MDRSEHAPIDNPSGEAPGLMAPLDLRLQMASNTARFAGARLAQILKDETITHVAVGDDRSRLRSIRETISRQAFLPPMSVSQMGREADSIA